MSSVKILVTSPEASATGANPSTHEHLHHPKADYSTTFTGYAAVAPHQDVSELSYNPPKLGDEWVEIAISHCGICGSDVGGIDSELMPTPYPSIMGHEVIGIVVAAGSAVRNVAVGDRVGLGAQCHACLDRKGNCPECASGWVQYCRNELTFSIHSRYPAGSHAEGQMTQGGWANRVRCSSTFVFPIPVSMPSAEAAPLLCGGITVFAPLRRHVTKSTMKVGVVGIGGLGHMALLFAAKMFDGHLELVAISHNANKKKDALQMGAKTYIDTSDPAQVKAAFRTLDFVLVTANGSDLDFHSWLSMVAFGGTLCTVGLTKAPFSVHAFDMGSQIKLVTSSIGTLDEMKDMLKFAAEHNVRPIVETLPMKQINEGIRKVRKGTARYRIVLQNEVQ